MSFYIFGSDSTGVNCVEPVKPVLDAEVTRNLSSIRPPVTKESVQILCTQIRLCTGPPEVQMKLKEFYETNQISNRDFVRYYLYDLKCQSVMNCAECKQPLLIYLIEQNPGMFACLMSNSGDMADHKEQILREREYGGKNQTLWDYVTQTLKPIYLKQGKKTDYKMIIRPLRSAMKY